MSDTKLNKAYEVALICAAQDGLEPEEVMSMADSVMTTPMLTMMMGQFFNEEELEDYDLMGAIEGMGEITKMLETAELGIIDDSYMSEVADIFGDSPVYNNLCLALCIVFCGADGEISSMEGEAINAVASNLTNLDSEVFQTLAEKVIAGIDLG